MEHDSPPFGIHDFVRSVHLDARPNHARSVIHDFVQQVARYGEIPPRCVIDDFVQQVARYGKIPPRCVICDFVQRVARYEELTVKFLVVGSYIMIAAFLPRGIDH